MSALLKFEQHLEAIHCSSCGIQFAAPADFWSARRSDGRSMYCPNGHTLSYRETESDKLKKQLEQEREQHRKRLEFERNHAESMKRELTAVKGQLTKTKKRIAKGVCPCCNRSFIHLERHMTTKHPDYDSKPSE
jgi:hypothetical protein